LTLTNMYPPHYYGGYELICRDVMDRFRADGHDVRVLTTTMRVPGVSDEDDATVERTLRFAWRDHVLQNPSVPRRLLDERHNHRMLRRALDAFEPDVVSVWNMGAMSLGLLEMLRRRRVPVVLNVCDDWLVYGPDLDPWVRLFVHRQAGVGRAVEMATRLPCRLPDLTDTTALFISDFTKRRAQSHSPMPLGRTATTWAGIDERDFPLGTGRAADPWRWRLLGVGRVDVRKGIDVAIRALALLPATATLTWVGAGDEAERARLDALAEELGVRDRVRWDVRRREELPAVYRAADVFVFPSTWAEPLGLVPIEAMACGLPVVASGTGGSGEFLIDRNTALVPQPVGDHRAFADAINELAADAALRQDLIAGGARVARELTIARLAETLDAWHQAAAGGFASGEPPRRELQIA
jgi:glycosyltransferase involved in cell wall biosynthesis